MCSGIHYTQGIVRLECAVFHLLGTVELCT